MTLDFENTVDENFDYFEKLYNHFCTKVLKHLKKKNNIFLEVDIINNENIQEINRDYRNIDRITDVISFAFDDYVEGEVKVKNPEIDFIGCIYISYERAKEQAKEIGNSFDREMCFLFVHGLLHLLGYDHMKKEDEEIMFGIQREIFEGENLW